MSLFSPLCVQRLHRVASKERPRRIQSVKRSDDSHTASEESSSRATRVSRLSHIFLHIRFSYSIRLSFLRSVFSFLSLLLRFARRLLPPGQRISIGLFMSHHFTGCSPPTCPHHYLYTLPILGRLFSPIDIRPPCLRLCSCLAEPILPPLPPIIISQLYVFVQY